MVLVRPDGRAIHVHQVILASFSRKFAAVLAHGDATGKELPIQGVDSAALESVIGFFYGGECLLSPMTVMPIYDVCLKLEVPGLSAGCEQYVQQNMNPQTCLVFLEASVQLLLEHVVKLCLNYAKSRFDEVVATPAFHSLSSETVRLLLTHTRVNAGDVGLARALARWAVRRPEHLVECEAMFKELNIATTALLQLLQSPDFVHAIQQPGSETARAIGGPTAGGSAPAAAGGGGGGSRIRSAVAVAGPTGHNGAVGDNGVTFSSAAPLVLLQLREMPLSPHNASQLIIKGHRSLAGQKQQPSSPTSSCGLMKHDVRGGGATGGDADMGDNGGRGGGGGGSRLSLGDGRASAPGGGKWISAAEGPSGGAVGSGGGRYVQPPPFQRRSCQQQASAEGGTAAAASRPDLGAGDTPLLAMEGGRTGGGGAGDGGGTPSVALRDDMDLARLRRIGQVAASPQRDSDWDDTRPPPAALGGLLGPYDLNHATGDVFAAPLSVLEQAGLSVHLLADGSLAASGGVLGSQQVPLQVVTGALGPQAPLLALLPRPLLRQLQLLAAAPHQQHGHRHQHQPHQQHELALEDRHQHQPRPLYQQHRPSRSLPHQTPGGTRMPLLLEAVADSNVNVNGNGGGGGGGGGASLKRDLSSDLLELQVVGVPGGGSASSLLPNRFGSSGRSTGSTALASSMGSGRAGVVGGRATPAGGGNSSSLLLAGPRSSGSLGAAGGGGALLPLGGRSGMTIGGGGGSGPGVSGGLGQQRQQQQQHAYGLVAEYSPPAFWPSPGGAAAAGGLHLPGRTASLSSAHHDGSSGLAVTPVGNGTGGGSGKRRRGSPDDDPDHVDEGSGRGAAGGGGGRGGRISYGGRGGGLLGDAGTTTTPGGSHSGLKPSLTCHVDDCHVDLSNLKEYHQRFRICDFHLKAETVMREGISQRFCQQCGRFHLLSEFDGIKRSCRARLQRHNARRRKRPEQRGSGGDGGSDEARKPARSPPYTTAGGGGGGGGTGGGQRAPSPLLPTSSLQQHQHHEPLQAQQQRQQLDVASSDQETAAALAVRGPVASASPSDDSRQQHQQHDVAVQQQYVKREAQPPDSQRQHQQSHAHCGDRATPAEQHAGRGSQKPEPAQQAAVGSRVVGAAAGAEDMRQQQARRRSGQRQGEDERQQQLGTQQPPEVGEGGDAGAASVGAAAGGRVGKNAGAAAPLAHTRTTGGSATSRPPPPQQQQQQRSMASVGAAPFGPVSASNEGAGSDGGEEDSGTETPSRVR